MHKPVARLFDPSRTSGVKQDAGRQIERLLRSTHNHDLLRLASHATRGPEISGDRFAEFGQSHRIAVLQCFQTHPTRIARDKLQPNLDWKFLELGLPDLEWAQALRPRRPLIFRKSCRLR